MTLIKKNQQKYFLLGLMVVVLLIALLGNNFSSLFPAEVLFNHQPIVYMNNPATFSESSVFDMRPFYYKLLVTSGDTYETKCINYELLNKYAQIRTTSVSPSSVNVDIISSDGSVSFSKTLTYVSDRRFANYSSVRITNTSMNLYIFQNGKIIITGSNAGTRAGPGGKIITSSSVLYYCNAGEVKCIANITIPYSSCMTRTMGNRTIVSYSTYTCFDTGSVLPTTQSADPYTTNIIRGVKEYCTSCTDAYTCGQTSTTTLPSVNTTCNAGFVWDGTTCIVEQNQETEIDTGVTGCTINSCNLPAPHDETNSSAAQTNTVSEGTGTTDWTYIGIISIIVILIGAIAYMIIFNKAGR